MIRYLIFLLTFLLFTVLTQVGGVAYALALCLGSFVKRKWRFKTPSLFLFSYLLMTFLLVPLVVPWFGRERVTHDSGIRPASYMTILLNRNYVRPNVNEVLRATARSLSGSPVRIQYLDANFPFWDGFPLLPHLSHNDGRKIDLGFIYQDAEGRISERQKTRSGYGLYESPGAGETDMPTRCAKRGFSRYDLTRYLTLGRKNHHLTFSEKGTKRLLSALLRQKGIQKIFIEPHLKSRLGFGGEKRVRFHGCRAVRHDDHIHLEVRD